MCNFPDICVAEDGDLFQNSSGTLICQALVKNYDSVVMKPLEQNYAIKLAVVNAVKSLLTLSVSAKMAALEGNYSSISRSNYSIHLMIGQSRNN